MNPCPNCKTDLIFEDRELICPGCGCFSQIDPTSGNLRFMLSGRVVSAPEDERLAYERAKEAYPEIYEEFENSKVNNS